MNYPLVLAGLFIWTAGNVLCLAEPAQTESDSSTTQSQKPNHVSIKLVIPEHDAIVLADELPVIVAVLDEKPGIAATLNDKSLELEQFGLDESWRRKNDKMLAALFGSRSTPGATEPSPAGNTADWVLLAAKVKLSPGNNVVRIGDAQLQLIRQQNPKDKTTAAQYPTLYTHPPAAKDSVKSECQACHAIKSTNNSLLLGGVKVPDSCHACHDLVDLRLIHGHVMEPLADCRICHAHHGSHRPSILIKDKAILCNMCHEGSHSTN